MAFARAIVDACRRAGRDPGGALREAQITPAQLQRPDGRITARQFETLTATAMRALDDEGLGAFSRRLPWGTYGMLARASLTAPTLGVALKRWCRHHALVTDDIRLELTTSGATATIALHEARKLPATQRELAIAFVLRNVHGLGCWFVDSRIPLRGAAFPYPAPPHEAAYAHMFPGPVAFAADEAAIRFDAQYLHLPIRRDEKAMQAMLQRALPITVLQYRRDRLLVQQVRQVLAAHPHESHSAEGVAQLLHVSVRTLHRQLKEEGASLQQIKDDVRFDRARELLLRTGRPLKQVADAVGFRSEKSFIRAFSQWTGVSPARFRAQQDGSFQPP